MDIFGRVSFIARNYWAIKRAIREEREPRHHEGPGGSGPGDPTAAQAIRNLTPVISVRVMRQRIYRPEDWIDAVDEGMKFCTQNEADILRWHLIEGKSERYLAAIKNINRKTLYVRQQRAISKIAICAARKGLLE